MRGLQRALSWIYPAQCLLCTTLVEEQGGLCPDCWRGTPFIRGLVCDSCGCSLPGSSDSDEKCDDCLATPRPWSAGRAALSYSGQGRRIVLSLKHGDRTDLALPAAEWMLRTGQTMHAGAPLFVPVPVHWSRLLARRYNQAAELSRALSKLSGEDYCPDALIRNRRTPTQDGMTVEQRFANVDGAIETNPARVGRLQGRTVCLVDDVMTSGASLSACADAVNAAGATRIFVLVLARVEKGS